MKSFYRTKSVSTGGGADIQIKYKGLHIKDSKVGKVTAAVQRARIWLPHAISLLHHPVPPSVAAAMSKYFKTGIPSMMEIQAVKTVLINTNNGIQSQFSMKLSGDAGAYGYVNYRNQAHGMLNGWEAGADKGDIHVDRGLFSSNMNLATITFIHEATHRYANTEDLDDQGYIENDGSDFWEPGLTKIDALRNADSYAWFVAVVCAGRGVAGALA